MLFSSCIAFFVPEPVTKPPADFIEHGFETGIIFRTDQSAIGNDIQVRIYLRPSMVLIRDLEIRWHANTSVSIPPGDYRIDAHVIYFGMKTWKAQHDVTINEATIIDYYFKDKFFTVGKGNVYIN
jgi:hypothetical protein